MNEWKRGSTPSFIFHSCRSCCPFQARLSSFSRPLSLHANRHERSCKIRLTFLLGSAFVGIIGATGGKKEKRTSASKREREASRCNPMAIIRLNWLALWAVPRQAGDELETKVRSPFLDLSSVLYTPQGPPTKSCVMEDKLSLSASPYNYRKWLRSNPSLLSSALLPLAYLAQAHLYHLPACSACLPKRSYDFLETFYKILSLSPHFDLIKLTPSVLFKNPP